MSAASKPRGSAPARRSPSTMRIARTTSTRTSSSPPTTERPGSRPRVICRTTTARSASSARIRATPRLLFAGTEFGAYVSFDRGEHWTLLESNLPTVRVDDIQIHPREHDLILGTHGRSLWVLDDITPLEQLAQARTSELTLFDMRPSISWRRFGPTNAQ